MIRWRRSITAMITISPKNGAIISATHTRSKVRAAAANRPAVANSVSGYTGEIPAPKQKPRCDRDVVGVPELSAAGRAAGSGGHHRLPAGDAVNRYRAEASEDQPEGDGHDQADGIHGRTHPIGWGSGR